MTRRQFASLTTAASYNRILGANDRVRMGFIGLGNRGDQVHDAFLEHGDSQTTAICDLREDYLDLAQKKSRGTPLRVIDYRRVLDSRDVDAVAIATPDHWHAIMFNEACKAGKDVYVEKPLSLTVFEGRRMVEAAARHKRVSQVGIHRRSSKFLKEAVDLIQSGGLGKITVARSYHIVNEWPNGIGRAAGAPPPNEQEWERWLGPAPKVPYNANRTYYNFRWFFHYSGGQLTNMGVHYMDMMRWALGKGAPRAVTALGGKWAVEDNREIPDTLEVLWEFDGGLMFSFSQYNANSAPGNLQNSEMEFRGTKGTLYLHGNRWEVVPEPVSDHARPVRTPIGRDEQRRLERSGRKPLIEPRVVKGTAGTEAHARNFLDCVKSRAKCNCDVLEGHLSTSATILGNIALKTRSFLEWDARTEKFTNNAAANQHLHYKYREPYRLD
ncbi:MAG: Gfo/Idh/MocA family oxidoreductase [Acidobacteria bacterium]|nr:Gfo/Idh/MocA family oxidoreductase [Acidobacteriota bacterium]